MGEGTLRNMAHDAKDINWHARNQIEEMSRRAPEPDRDYTGKPGKISAGIAAIFCLTAAGLMAITWIIYF